MAQKDKIFHLIPIEVCVPLCVCILAYRARFRYDQMYLMLFLCSVMFYYGVCYVRAVSGEKGQITHSTTYYPPYSLRA